MTPPPQELSPTAGRPARARRRAQRPATGGPAEDAGASGRGLDDSDTGWDAEPVPGGDEDRWRRERPPHWG